ncbi:hypothetical protein ElyMa_003621500 [Elysia marginata]|uniref:Uncharacterized protein n=1 Tax=Elysia marginata TaxID=1093978 RepID=A0AAV4ETN1_9GAST|nr:hypothetical protein ElyMa_003621500 [Elysia marginata]
MNGQHKEKEGEEEIYDPIGVFDVPTDDADKVEPRPDDHYGFPYRWLSSGIFVNGYPVFRCPVKIPPATHIRKMMALPMREDDVVLTGFVKSGVYFRTFA